MNTVRSAFTELLVRSCGVQCGSNEAYTPSSPVAVRHSKNKQNSKLFDATTAQNHTPISATTNFETLYSKRNCRIMSQHDVIQFTESGNIVGESDEQVKEFPEYMRSSSTVGTDPSVADSDSFADALSDAVEFLPTLPCYAETETINKNCWSQPQVSIFQVRGPNYLTDKKKITSSSYLFPARGSDLYLADSTTNISMSKMYVY
jgi:Protein ENHANCED DISEASE RESISTANCE 2, C-terminal